jgi:cell division transport system permease protein
MLNKGQAAYLARESFAGFHRRKLTTGVTILIMGASLLVLAVLTLATLNLGYLLETARESIDIRVFLKDSATLEEIATLQPRLVIIPGVEKVNYVSPETALNEFRNDLGADSEILDLLPDNPLPASYHVVLKNDFRNLEAVRSIRDEITAWPQVGEIVFNQEWIDSLERWAFRFQMASLVVGLLVFLAAVFVISNTVKLTMAASARIIQIQKLVGATNSFIRTPYLFEGVLQGLLAGVLAMGFVATMGWVLSDHLTGVVFFSPWQIGGFIVFCAFLGFTGSFAAIRKYLMLGSEF